MSISLFVETLQSLDFLFPAPLSQLLTKTLSYTPVFCVFICDTDKNRLVWLYRTCISFMRVKNVAFPLFVGPFIPTNMPYNLSRREWRKRI